MGATKKILIRQSEKRAQEKKLKNDKVAEELEKKLKEKDLLDDDDLAQKLKRDQLQPEIVSFQSLYSKLWKEAKFDTNDRVYHDLVSAEAIIKLSSDVEQLMNRLSTGMESVDVQIVSDCISDSSDYRNVDSDNKEVIFIKTPRKLSWIKFGQRKRDFHFGNVSLEGGK